MLGRSYLQRLTLALRSRAWRAVAWDIQTVASWAPAIIDDSAQEVASSGAAGRAFTAEWSGIRLSDGSLGAAIKIRGAEETCSEHRVTIS